MLEVIVLLIAIYFIIIYWFASLPILFLAYLFLRFTSVGKRIFKKYKDEWVALEKERKNKEDAEEKWERQRVNDREREREQKENDRERERHQEIDQRDADKQDWPYNYEIGRHANETLALRYGIANLNGIDGRGQPAKSIALRKLEKIDKNVYLVEISDFRKRKAKAVIEVGTEYVKTFLPMSEDWFSKYANLEETLKGNKTMSLKDIARFHVEKVVK